MAEKSTFFNSVNGDRKYTAEDMAAHFAKMLTNGVMPAGTQLQVIESGGMNVAASAGSAWINGYVYHNDANFVLAIDPADGAVNRVDRIVVRWNKLARSINLTVLKGTPASSAVAPDIVRNADYYDLSIATINVNKGITAITQALITDTRMDSNVCGFVSSLIRPDTSGWFVQFETAFNEWFDGVKDALGSDVAGNLQNQINELQTQISEIKTLSGKVPPTASMVGTVGQFYLDTTTKTLYQCVAVDGGVYTWENSAPCIMGVSDPTVETSGRIGQFYYNTVIGAFFQCVAISNDEYTWEMQNGDQIGDIRLSKKPSLGDKYLAVNGQQINSVDQSVLFNLLLGTPGWRSTYLYSDCVGSTTAGNSGMINICNGYYIYNVCRSTDNGYELCYYYSEDGKTWHKNIVAGSECHPLTKIVWTGVNYVFLAYKVTDPREYYIHYGPNIDGTGWKRITGGYNSNQIKFFDFIDGKLIAIMYSSYTYKLFFQEGTTPSSGWSNGNLSGSINSVLYNENKWIIPEINTGTIKVADNINGPWTDAVTLQTAIIKSICAIAYIDGMYIAHGYGANNNIVIAYCSTLTGAWQYTVTNLDTDHKTYLNSRFFKWENKLVLYSYYHYGNRGLIYFYTFDDVHDTTFQQAFYTGQDYVHDPCLDFFDFAKCQDKGVLFFTRALVVGNNESCQAYLSSTLRGDAKSLPTIDIDGTNSFIRAQA